MQQNGTMRAVGSSASPDPAAFQDWWAYARESVLECAALVNTFDRQCAETMRAVVTQMDAFRDAYFEREVDAQEAARLAGCDVSQIHRDIESGKLSDRRPQGKGKHAILVKELMEARGLRPVVETQGTKAEAVSVDELADKMLHKTRNITVRKRRAS